MAPRCSPCRRLLAVPRALVSQNKRRFQQDGFDLDLGYVHPRVIVMGYPAVGVEFLFRNPRSEVQQFLDERHAGDYFVFNFCDEPKRCYSPSIFEGRAKSFPIEDHNVPTFQMMMAFCDEAAAWLDANEKHVVALHCKAQSSVPGQDIVEPTFAIQKLTLRNTLTAAKLPTLRLRIFTLSPDGSPKTLLHQEIGPNEFEMHLEIRGCIGLEFYRERASGCMRAKHFKLWFNTYFLKPGTKHTRVD
uniref:Phosphatase tensin-type domain-containing protein n=1 Tax=Phytophthora ramorum TaxID=164328 RepID=H3GTU2_PHYRM